MRRSQITGSLWVGATIGALALAACGPRGDLGSTDETGDAAGEDSTSGEETTDDGNTPPDLPTEDPCGNGVVDYDEACDDGNADDCDACSNRCQVQSMDDVEWMLALPNASVSPDDLKVAASGAIYLRTDESLSLSNNGQPWSQIDLANVTAADIEDFDVAPDGALAVLVRSGSDVSVLGVDADGTLNVELGVSSLAPSLQVPLADTTKIERTPAGFALWNDDGVASYDWSGGLLWEASFTASRRVDANSDWLVLIGGGLQRLKPDGTEATDVPRWIAYRMATNGRYMTGAYADDGFGEVTFEVIDLQSGTSESRLVATGEGGLESGPFAGSIVEVTPGGNPVGYFSVCPFGSGSSAGCLEERWEGFTGLPRTSLGFCGDRDSLRISADGNVHFVGEWAGEPVLIRRWTL